MQTKIAHTEWKTRLELAAAYHLAANFGWTDLIYSHISARTTNNTYFINPFGLLFHEVTPENLIEVDFDGNVISNTNYEVNPAGIVVHGAVYETRPDVQCVIHLHTPNGIAVSTAKEGLMPISQHALHLFGEISYHNYGGIAFSEDERKTMARDLGNKKIMLLRNHGFLTAGASVPEAFMLMYMLEKAAEIQVTTLSQKLPICSIPLDVCRLTKDQADSKRFKHLYLEWQALLRTLDTSVFRPLIQKAA